MNKSNSLRVALSLTFLLPAMGMGEYEDYSSRLGDLSKDTSKVGDVLGSGATGSSEESFSEKIQKTLKKAGVLLKTRQDEQEQREKLANWTKKNDAKKNIPVVLDSFMQSSLKKRETDLGTAEAMLSSLGKKNNFLNPQDFSMNGMPKECRKNVDFTQFMALTEQLGSEPFKYLQGEAGKLLEEKVTDLKKKQAAKIADIMKHFKELANKEEGEEVAKIDAIKGNNAIEQRLERLKQANKKAKEESKELSNGLVDVFGKFVSDLGTLQQNDKRVRQLGDEFAKSIENSQRAAMMTAQQNVDQLFANCESEIKLLKIEIENFKGHLISRGWDPAVAEADANAQRARAQAMQCTDVTQNVQSLLMGFGTGGTALSDRLSRVRAEKNPTKLLSEAVAAMQDVANIQQQVGSQLKPLMQDCEDAGTGREGLKQRFAQLGASTGQPTGSTGGTTSSNTGSTTGQRRSTGTNGQTTHGGLGARQGSF